MMFTGIVLYRKSNGNEIIYSGMREDEMMGYVRTNQGVTYPEQTIGSILARGYWEVAEEVNTGLRPNGGYDTLGVERLEKHGTHDQSSHNPHKGGRGSLAGGTRYEPEEILDVYAEAEFDLTMSENAAVQDYVAQGHRLNSAIRRGDEKVYYTDEKTVAQTASELDTAIASAPPMEDMAVWRVANVRSVEGLKVGDVVRDRGYASTTVADLTDPKNGMKLLQLNSISSGKKVLVEINTGEEGKGLFIPAIGVGPTVDFEQEFLLPRESLMEYLGVRDMPNSSLSPASVIHQFKVVSK